MRLTTLFLSLCVTMMLLSCDSSYYSNSVDFEDNVWSSNTVFDNSFSITDTTKRYNLYLDVDHSSEYAFENIYIDVETVFPDKDPTTQQLPINLSDKKGKWYGRCGGDNCNLKVVLKENTRFQSFGDYSLNFRQVSREATLNGIQGLSFFIEEAEAK